MTPTPDEPEDLSDKFVMCFPTFLIWTKTKRGFLVDETNRGNALLFFTDADLVSRYRSEHGLEVNELHELNNAVDVMAVLEEVPPQIPLAAFDPSPRGYGAVLTIDRLRQLTLARLAGGR